MYPSCWQHCSSRTTVNSDRELHSNLRKAAEQQRDGGSGKHKILGNLLLHLIQTTLDCIWVLAKNLFNYVCPRARCSDRCTTKGLLSTGPVDYWAQALWTPCFHAYTTYCQKLGPSVSSSPDNVDRYSFI